MTKKRPGRPYGPMNGNEGRPWKRERRVYIFICDGCGREDAQTVRRSRARGKLCRKCRNNDVNPDQIALFDMEVSA